MKAGLKYLLILIWAAGLDSQNLIIPKGFQADFVQKITNPNKKIIQYSGKVLMGGGKYFKWSYVKPTKKEVCGNGKVVVVVDHDLEQASFYRLQKGFDLKNILKHARHYKGNLYTAKYQGKTYTIAVNQHGWIEQIAYRDKMDNIVNIHFYKIKTMTTAPAPSKMSCSFPESYDLIGKR